MTIDTLPDWPADTMVGSKTLIAGMSYVRTHFDRDLTLLWAKTIHHLNPDTDILLVDSASPINPADFLPVYVSVFRFEDNIGHQARGGGDGAGRAFCKIIEVAAGMAYDYVAVIENDMLFAQPVAPWIEKMQTHGIRFMAPMDATYRFLEGGLCFYEVAYMVESRFVERYDWPSTGTEMPEHRVERLVKGDWWIPPLRGIRNDFSMITVQNLRSSFPVGLEYVTHCKHFDVYLRFLEMNGIRLDGG